MNDPAQDTPMTDSEAEAFVVGVLRTHGSLSTMEIEMLARERRRRCPDQTVLYLAKLKYRGVIDGEVSVERRGWVWWLAGDQTPPG